MYGERGVWRPGDSLFMTFILEDKFNLLPESHPVIFELQNPQGSISSRLVKSNSENNFYKFATATDAEAPTGNWLARVKVGGTEFSQTVKIETVKPNRLKINLDFGTDKLKSDNAYLNGNLQVNWLHGAPGKNLKAEFEVFLTKGETKFPNYPDFTFEDASLEFYSESQQVFEGYTNAEGNAQVNARLEVSSQAPGVLNAIFRGKVFEEGGNFSIDRFSIPYYPYKSFTGIRLPPGDKARGMLLTDTTQRVDVVTVDADGNPVSRNQIEMSLYKVEWSWWWDYSSSGTVNYMSGKYSKPIATSTIRTTNGKGVWDFEVKHPEWGRFLVKAYDPVSGHSTSKVVYIDWPGWAGRAREGSDGATMLSFSSDKTMYEVGEKASIVIPGSNQARALISIENGSKVIKTFWLETNQGDNPFTFDITSEMTPNIFINVSLLQAHGQTINDLPIRLYGVIPVRVEDPKTHLNPVISMPDVLEPGQEVSIRVSEQNNRKMTYTLAMVDEGLLDLTRFKTPDAWNRFYAREALGVKTWDVYDAVIGSFGGKLERLLAVGGDGEMASKEDDSKANRFKPVVKFFGPFTVDGKTSEHKFTMPNYIGSVKTMVVAGDQGAYGKAEKVTPVRKPLMVLTTLPRVLGPGERLKLPVTLFTMDPNIKNISVEVNTTGQLNISGSKTQNVSMNGNEMTIDFDISVTDRIGKGTVEVIAKSGNNRASENIEIEIRNPNPPIVRVQESIVEAGKTWSGNVAPIGLPGTNSAVLEVSSFPPINLGQRLNYLLQYPHGCIEQTTSSVFPQLYLSGIKELTEVERINIQNNVKAAINRLKLFTTSDGGFAYWPGGSDSESWGSTYAGHFLLEAEAQGYFVPGNLIKQWKRYQKGKASSWRRSNEPRSELTQAYRLYTLAIAHEADLSAMNRLREQTSLPADVKWMLRPHIAKQVSLKLPKRLLTMLPRP
ncbi:MAG: hypothetical protein HC811_04475 [Flammeovirgaceae bacterium]|nr:hypothetical protein [Flammeovirgaceae bacterium]